MRTITRIFALILAAIPMGAWADTFEIPTDAQHTLAVSLLKQGKYRIKTTVSGETKYIKMNNSNYGNYTTEIDDATVFDIFQVSSTGNFKEISWRIGYGAYNFGSTGKTQSSGATPTIWARNNNHRASYETQVLFAKEVDGKYYYAVRTTNATAGNVEEVGGWNSWMPNCYWMNGDTDPQLDGANTGQGAFVWQFERVDDLFDGSQLFGSSVTDNAAILFKLRGNNKSYNDYYVQDGTPITPWYFYKRRGDGHTDGCGYDASTNQYYRGTTVGYQNLLATGAFISSNRNNDGSTEGNTYNIVPCYKNITGKGQWFTVAYDISVSTTRGNFIMYIQNAAIGGGSLASGSATYTYDFPVSGTASASQTYCVYLEADAAIYFMPQTVEATGTWHSISVTPAFETPTDVQHALAVSQLKQGKFRIKTTVSGETKYIKMNNSNYGNYTTEIDDATVFDIFQVSSTGNFKDISWRIGYGAYNFGSTGKTQSSGATPTIWARKDNHRASYETQVLFAKEEAGEYYYAVRSTNATAGNVEEVGGWNSWMPNCYWRNSAEYPQLDGANTGQGAFVWQFERVDDLFDGSQLFGSSVADNAAILFKLRGNNKSSNDYYVQDGTPITPWYFYKRRGDGYTDGCGYDASTNQYYRGTTVGYQNLLTTGAFISSNQNTESGKEGNIYNIVPCYKNITGKGQWFTVAYDFTVETSRNDYYMYLTNAAIGGGRLASNSATYTYKFPVSTSATVSQTYCVYLDADAAIYFMPQTVEATGTWNSISVTPLTSYTMTVNEWGTLCLPFCTDALPDGITAYNLTGVQGANQISSEEVTAIMANQPVLLKASGSVEVTFTSNGTVAASGDATTNGLLTGVYAPTTSEVGSYVLQKHDGVMAFYRVYEATQPTIKPFRAYLTVGSVEGAAQMLRIGEDATGIEPSAFIASPTATIYDLAGRRVEKMEKGCYIVNGRKVIK